MECFPLQSPFHFYFFLDFVVVIKATSRLKVYLIFKACAFVFFEMSQYLQVAS
jgi:hypothetical protein